MGKKTFMRFLIGLEYIGPFILSTRLLVRSVNFDYNL